MDVRGAMIYNREKAERADHMDITQRLVERIAHLARLSLSEEEKARMTTRLEDVLGSVTELDTLALEEDTEQEQGGGGR